jgi:hypothetical protein
VRQRWPTTEACPVTVRAVRRAPGQASGGHAARRRSAWARRRAGRYFVVELVGRAVRAVADLPAVIRGWARWLETLPVRRVVPALPVAQPAQHPTASL